MWCHDTPQPHEVAPPFLWLMLLRWGLVWDSRTADTPLPVPRTSALHSSTCRSHAVCTAYPVLRSLKLPTAALHLVECTFHGGFESLPLRHSFKYLQTAHASEESPTGRE